MFRTYLYTVKPFYPLAACNDSQERFDRNLGMYWSGQVIWAAITNRPTPTTVNFLLKLATNFGWREVPCFMMSLRDPSCSLLVLAISYTWTKGRERMGKLSMFSSPPYPVSEIQCFHIHCTEENSLDVTELENLWFGSVPRNKKWFRWALAGLCSKFTILVPPLPGSQ